MRKESIKTRIRNRLGNRWVIQFLLVIQFMSTRVSTGMVVAEVFVIVLNGTDDVSLHDLHVIDVVQQLEVVRTHLFAEFNTPSGIVAHVVGVIDPAIEQLHIEDDIFLFCDADDLFKSRRTILYTRLAIDTACVAGETNNVAIARRRRGFDRFIHLLQRGVMVLLIAQSIGERMRGNHGAYQTVLLKSSKVLRFEKIDPDQTQLHGLHTHFF